MARASKDLTNTSFGYYTVLGPAAKRGNNKYWLCRCVCGSQKEISASNLQQGIRSCGCRRSELMPTAYNFQDLAGQTFGRLTVLRRTTTKGELVRWLCLCSCGNTNDVAALSLTTGHSRSCGCLKSELTAERGRSRATHGHKRNYESTPEYRSWASLRSRCQNKDHPQYDDYGGRGITVCARWDLFRNFLEDMGKRPSLKHSIDRFPDNNGNYEPGNCRWATSTQQNRNRRSSKMLTFRNATYCQKEWAERYGINPVTFKWRVLQGWPMEKALGLLT